MKGIPEFFRADSAKGAWHGDGVTFPDAIANDHVAVLNACELNYEVGTIPYKNAITGEDVDDYGIYNLQSGNHFGTCKKGYQPLSNLKVLETLHDIMTDQNIGIDSIIHWPKEGFIAANYKLMEYDVVKGDPSIAFVQVVNGNNGSTLLTYLQSHVRMVCENTVTHAMTSANAMLAFKHTLNVETRLLEAGEIIKAMANETWSYVDRLKFLSGNNLSGSQVNNILDNLFGPEKVLKSGEAKNNARTKVLQLFEENDGKNGISGIRGTAYNLFNAITQYTTHASPVSIHGKYDPKDRIKLEYSQRMLKTIKAGETPHIEKFWREIQAIM